MAFTYPVALPTNGNPRSASNLAALYAYVNTWATAHANNTTPADQHDTNAITNHAPLPLTTPPSLTFASQHFFNDMAALAIQNLAGVSFLSAPPITLKAINDAINNHTIVAASAATAGALTTPLPSLMLSELRPSATGTSMVITVAPGAYTDTGGVTRYYFGGGTVTAISDPAQSKWFLLGMDTANTPHILHSSPGAGPETIVTTGYAIFAAGLLPAAATAVYQQFTGTPAGQGYLAARVLGGGGGGGGGSSYTNANVVSVMTGGTGSGSGLSNVSNSIGGTLADALSAQLGFDPRQRINYTGTTINLVAGTAATGPSSPAVLTVGPTIYKNTATISATVSGSSGRRYLALDWTGSAGGFALAVLTDAQVPTATQLIIGQCYFDAGYSGGAVAPGSMVFDYALAIGSRQVAIEAYRSASNLTPVAQTVGGPITPSIVTSGAQFWLGNGAIGRVAVHARGSIAYASSGVATATSGFAIVARVKNGTTYNAAATSTDIATATMGAVGLFTVDPWEDFLFSSGWNTVTPFTTVTDSGANACTVTWQEIHLTVQLYAAGLLV